MAKTVWVLTREHNDYDQHGGYFVAVFNNRPEIDELAEVLRAETATAVPDNVMAAVAFLLHIRKGGGRRETEEVWFNLTQEELR